jgi:NAD(P)-dependent dehydrogenase (short-subunit alcohol dehydrogenase family)
MQLTPPPLVFITGASSGIGQALALRYHQAGWRLALVARRANTMHDWAQAQGLRADHYRVFAADVSDNASIIDAAEQCMASLGLPQVVIANAGISQGMDTAVRGDLAVLQRVMSTNVLGLAATFHPFIAPMQAQADKANAPNFTLVGIASVAGIRGLPGHSAYCASKAAVISYCESLRGELRGHRQRDKKSKGLRVVTIAPGYVDTPLTRKNKYPMPFLMSPQVFADQAFACIAKGESYRVIPWPMGVVARLLRLLPNAVFDRLLQNQPRKHRDPA